MINSYNLWTNTRINLLPDQPTVEVLQEHWDQIIAADKKAGWSADFCGCILPNHEDVVAGPNNRRFILRPCDHANKHHKQERATSSSSLPLVARKRPIDAASSSSNTLINSSGVVRTKENCSQIGTTSTGKKVKTTIKNSAIQFQPTITSLLDPKVHLFEKPKDRAQTWSQNFALSVIQSGVNKTLSQAATLDVYETAMEGVRSYHSTIIGDIEFDGKKAPPPPGITLHDHNLPKIQHGMLEAYKQMDISAYKSVKHGGPYSIFNDGIQKFSNELNGVMVRTLDEEWNIVNVPWALSKIPGGSMDNVKLASQLVNVMGSINKFQNPSVVNAEASFLRTFESQFPNEIAPKPPSIFRCTTIISDIGFLNKHIDLLFENWPVALVGDGCGVNPKAAERLTYLYGLLSPNLRCSGHAASGSMR